MTDSTNTISASQAAINAGIDALVDNGGSFDHVTITPTVGAMSYNTESGELVQTGGATDAARIQDKGLDTDFTARQISDGLHALQAKLDEVTFDKETGKASYVLPEGSEQRDLAMRQLTRARDSAAYDSARFDALEAQRNADRVAEQAGKNKTAALHAFAHGDPVRTAAINDALLRAEADEVAKALISAQRIGRANGTA